MGRRLAPLVLLIVGSGSCVALLDAPFTSSSDCDELYDGSCYCTYAEDDGNRDTCSVETVGGGLCCADIGWPDESLQCECEAYRCQETADGCSCGLGDDGPLTTCTGPICCLSTYSCSCGSEPCSSIDTQVPSCGIEAARCDTNEQAVSECSAFEVSSE